MYHLPARQAATAPWDALGMVDVIVVAFIDVVIVVAFIESTVPCYKFMTAWTGETVDKKG